MTPIGNLVLADKRPRSVRWASQEDTRVPPTRLRTARPSALTESCSFITIRIDDVWLDESEQRAQLLASSNGVVPTLAREGMVLALS
jgi:hypothetical protein